MQKNRVHKKFLSPKMVGFCMDRRTTSSYRARVGSPSEIQYLVSLFKPHYTRFARTEGLHRLWMQYIDRDKTYLDTPQTSGHHDYESFLAEMRRIFRANPPKHPGRKIAKRKKRPLNRRHMVRDRSRIDKQIVQTRRRLREIKEEMKWAYL